MARLLRAHRSGPGLPPRSGSGDDRRASVRVLLPAIAALASGISTTPGTAQPTVRVRGETRIELRMDRGQDPAEAASPHHPDAADPAGQGTTILRGVLRDDLGAPIAGQPLTVRIAPAAAEPAADGSEGGPTERRELSTDGTGAFALPLPGEHGRYRVEALFAGTQHYEGVRSERLLDLRRAGLKLRVSLADGPQLDLGRRAHVVRVQAESPAGADQLPITLVDELGRRLAQDRTDRVGEVTWRVPSSRLGPPGAGRLIVRSVGDERRAAARTEVPIVRFHRTQLTLEVPSTRVRVGDAMTIEGELRDPEGPLPGRAIGLYATPADGSTDHPLHLGTVLTDGEGRYRHELALGAEQPTALALQARFSSDAPAHRSSRSKVVQLQARAPGGVSWLWLLVPIALCTAALLALRWIERRSAAPAAPAPFRAGISAAPPARGRPARHDVAGQVVDARDGRPVPQAMASLIAPDRHARDLPIDERGRFQRAELEAGTWILRVEAPGYGPAETRLDVPHRGQWSRLDVRLESVRALALAPFRRLALRVLPDWSLWPVRTNREVVHAAPPSLPLATLSQRVERAYYGPDAPTADEIEAIEEAAKKAREGLVDTSERPPAGTRFEPRSGGAAEDESPR